MSNNISTHHKHRALTRDDFQINFLYVHWWDINLKQKLYICYDRCIYIHPGIGLHYLIKVAFKTSCLYITMRSAAVSYRGRKELKEFYASTGFMVMPSVEVHKVFAETALIVLSFQSIISYTPRSMSIVHYIIYTNTVHAAKIDFKLSSIRTIRPRCVPSANENIINE